MLKLLQDETVHTTKVLALASLCIPLGACITSAVCTAMLWSISMDDKQAQVQRTAVVMQGKVRQECCLLENLAVCKASIMLQSCSTAVPSHL